MNWKQKKQKFSFSFGIVEQGVEQAIKENLGDGVEFKVIALNSNGQQETIFSRQLQPMKNLQDRGKQQVSIELSQINATKFILETVPGKDTSYDWSYWSDLKAE